MQPCKILEDLIPLYISGDLDAAEADRVREHLSTCPSCQSFYHDLQKITKLLHAEPIEMDPAYGAELVVALNDRLHAREVRARRWHKMMVYASTLLVIFSTVVLLKERFFKTEQPALSWSEDYYSALLKIGYFNEMPLLAGSDEKEPLTVDKVNMVNDLALNVLTGNRLLPVEDFVEVTAPLAESEFESIYQNLADQPF